MAHRYLRSLRLAARPWATLSVAAALGACGSSGKTSSGSIEVTVTPAPAGVLTCSTVPFTATVTGTGNSAVSWSVAPATGAIGADGRYVAPLVTPIAGLETVTVTATSVASTKASDTTPPIAIATAFPGAVSRVAASTGTSEGTIGVYQHAAARSGSRAYASWANNPAGGSEVQMMVARSNDAGKTWAAAAPAIDAQLLGGATTSDGWLDCPAIAVDPANPDVVYAVATINSPNTLGAAYDDTYGPALVFSISTDGGRTFTPSVLSTASGAFSPCPDIASPAANTVVITAAGTGCQPADPYALDIHVWSDANQGAGFAYGAYDGYGAWWANGETQGLARLEGDASCGGDLRLFVGSSDAGSGQMVESPRMFTDGQGTVCVAYAANTTDTYDQNTFVQCSGDAGGTFTPAAKLAPWQGFANQPSGAFGPAGAVAAAWTDQDDPTWGQVLYVATSADGGASFGAPVQVSTVDAPFTPSVAYDAAGVLWIAYVVNGDAGAQVVVDKSCDGGVTFSGPVVVNTGYDLVGPSLLPGAGPAPNLAGQLVDAQAMFTLSP